MNEDVPCLLRIGESVNRYKRLKLEKDQVFIGRSRKATYTISSNIISRWHAIISQLKDQRWSIMDANSLNGIHVNGHQLRPFTPYTLKEGDFVQFSVSDSNNAEFEYMFHSSLQAQEDLQHIKDVNESHTKEVDVSGPNAQTNLQELQNEIQLDRENLEPRKTVQENDVKLNDNNKAIMAKFSAKRQMLQTDKNQVLKKKDMGHELLKRKLNETQVECAIAKLNALKAQENVLSDVVKFMDMELQCGICKELLVKATTLSCSHMFCKQCISQWMQAKDECPDCHTPISSLTHVVALDNCIDKIVEQLSGRMVLQRTASRKRKRGTSLAAAVTAAALTRSATLNMATERRATVVDNEAGPHKLALTRLASPRRSQSAAKTAPIKTTRAVNVTRKEFRKAATLSTVAAVKSKRTQYVAEAAVATVATGASTCVPSANAASTLTAVEKVAIDLGDGNKTSGDSKNSTNSSNSGSSKEVSGSSSSYSGEDGSDINMSSHSEDGEGCSVLKDSKKGENDVDDNCSRLRIGSQLPLDSDSIEPMKEHPEP